MKDAVDENAFRMLFEIDPILFGPIAIQLAPVRSNWLKNDLCLSYPGLPEAGETPPGGRAVALWAERPSLLR